MVDAYDILMEVLSLVNKEENGYLPADLFNRYASNANREVFNDYITRLQNPQTAMVEKQKLEDRLAPFDVSAVQLATGGLFTVPDECAYFRSAKIQGDGGATALQVFALNAQICEAETDPSINAGALQRQLDELYRIGNSQVAVELKDHDQLSKRLNSYVPGKKPSLKKPVMERTVVNGKRGFQVYPPVDGSVFFNFYRRPAAVNLVMDPDPVTMELLYMPQKSTGFEWEQEAMQDVILKIVQNFSIFIREGALLQMAQSQIKP